MNKLRRRYKYEPFPFEKKLSLDMLYEEELVEFFNEIHIATRKSMCSKIENMDALYRLVERIGERNNDKKRKEESS